MKHSRRKIPAAIRHVQLRLLYPSEYIAYLGERERLNIYRYPATPTTKETTS